MDNNEKIQLDDITFDDVIGGDGVDTITATEEVSPPQEDEKQIESSEESTLDDIGIGEDIKEKEEEYEENLPPFSYSTTSYSSYSSTTFYSS